MTAAPMELRTANAADRVALRGVHLHARLAGMSQRVTLEQTFVNLENCAIEAVYTFPLPENAAVCRFEVITGDRVLTGAIDENDKAVERYEEAVSEGHGAFMVEQERPDIFNARVGNLKPRQAATIRLTYVAPLEVVDRQIRLAFPTTVAPRYVTDSGVGDPVATAVSGDAINPPHVLSVPYGLSITVDVALGRKLQSITSPSHRITVEETDEVSRRVRFAGGIAEMDRDVVLSIELAKDHQPWAQVGRDKQGDSYVAVSFLPEFDAKHLDAPQATETLFVLDCSGSMMGDSIHQAVAALQLCLRSMSEGDTFNICRFGSTFEMLSSEPLVYNDGTLRRALGYISQTHDLGGTELHAPLEHIFNTPVAVGAARQIILLTDGQVSNESAIIDLARRHRNRNRIFSFGIGSGASQTLVKGLARATGGAAEFITAGERIDDKVLRTFSRIASPAAHDVRIDWGNADVQTLAELPPLFDGDSLTVYGRVLGKAPAQVALSCNTATGPARWALAVPPAVEDDGLIATMWARRAIQSLEEVNNLSHLSNAVRRQHKDAQALINLSREFNLLTSLTTFIAIEHRTLEERNAGMPEVRRVPALLARGWGREEAEQRRAIGGIMKCAAPMAAPACAATMDFDDEMASPPASGRARMAKSATPARGGGGLIDKLKRKLAGKTVDSSVRTFDKAFPAERERSKEQAPADPLLALLNLQSAAGEFPWDAAIATALAAVDEQALRAFGRAFLADRNLDPATAPAFLTLAAFEKRFADRKDLWRRAARKATAWLAKRLNTDVEAIDATVTELAQAI